MYISQLSISNYRNFRHVNFLFTKGVNTIIGENGSGKTNALKALRLLIDDSLPRRIQLHESDFNRGIENWRGHWIIISIEFSELDDSDELQALSIHKVGHANDNEKKGSLTLYFRPKKNIRAELYEYSLEDEKPEEGLNEILDKIKIDDYETVARGKGSVDFSNNDFYTEHVGDFENIKFPNPDDEDTEVYGIPLSTISIPSEVSCVFVKALRDVESELRSYRTSPLLSLMRGKGKKIEVSKKDYITQQVTDLNEEISDLDEVKKVSEGVTENLKNAVGNTYAPNVSIKSELPSDMEQLLQSLKLFAGDPDESGHAGKLWELSLGGANLIYLSLKLLEYEQVKSKDRVANFLLIEEPEAHIHTHIQKTLFQKLNKKDTQVIITTHSTHISSVSKISSVNVLSRGHKEAHVFHPTSGLDKTQVTKLERYLDAVRSNLLFAKGVCLVEGDAEQILIPEMFKAAFGISLDELGVSIINIGSTGFKNVAEIFHSERVQKKCAIITDLDASIVSLKGDEEEDTKEEKHYRNAQKKGLERQNNLDEFASKNDWIDVFYANNTFEVDFLLAGNEYEIKLAIDNHYKDATVKAKSKKKIDSDSNEIKSKEVLRLADTIGKGWFAIQIAEYLDYYTYLPEYILKSIAFSSGNIPEETKVAMIKYRLDRGSKNNEDEDQKTYLAITDDLSTLNNIELIERYSNDLPEDQLTQFLNFIES